VFVPEVRMYWRRSDKRLGTVSAFGVAVCVWAPTLVFLGIVPKSYGGWVYFAVMVGFLIAAVGCLMDVHFPLDERKR
jgi:hypothetical protein